MSDPNWRENVLRRYRQSVANSGRAKSVFGRALRPLQVTTTLEFLEFVDAAAKLRNVNRFTYVRRACAILAAADLDMDVRVVLAESPAPGPYGKQAMRTSTGGARDLGHGIDTWCPHPGCDGTHLRPEGYPSQ